MNKQTRRVASLASKQMHDLWDKVNLEAFPVNNGWTRLIVFLLGNPHLLESGQRRKNGTSDPDRVFPFRWGDDLDFHGGRSHALNILLHPIGNARIHGGTSRQNGVGIEIFPDVYITFHD